MPSQSLREWRPTATLACLRLRAEILDKIRKFFASRGVLEVETPILCATTLTHPDTQTIATTCDETDPSSTTLYLQTSPESAMKRLLASGSGPIYQICKAFRSQERGPYHNPEFSILEWYRPGFNHLDLMEEVNSLLQDVLGTAVAERKTYWELFQEFLGLNPHTASNEALYQYAMETSVSTEGAPDPTDRDGLLEFLMKCLIESHLGWDRPIFVYDFPASQACLARIRSDSPPVAERFELFARGIELANGYHELTDRDEQRERFLVEAERRKVRGRKPVPVDEKLLAALANGLPKCAGVAVGLDRLVMLAANTESLDEVISFTVERA